MMAVCISSCSILRCRLLVLGAWPRFLKAPSPAETDCERQLSHFV